MIVVYEKEKDLSAVILGIEQDPKRAQFDAICDVLVAQGVAVTRYNALTHPDETKDKALPSVYCDGELIKAGDYPNTAEMAAACKLEASLFDGVIRTSILNEANSTRLGSCCGVGQDVYDDPDEEELWK